MIPNEITGLKIQNSANYWESYHALSRITDSGESWVFSTIGRKIYYKIEDIQKLIVEKGISSVNTRELFNK